MAKKMTRVLWLIPEVEYNEQRTNTSYMHTSRIAMQKLQRH